MKEFELENMSREMPYKMPEHFLDDLTERVVAEIGREKRRHKQRRIYLMFASAAAVAAVILLALLPFGFGGTVPVCPTMKPSPSAPALMRYSSPFQPMNLVYIQ